MTCSPSRCVLRPPAAQHRNALLDEAAPRVGRTGDTTAPPGWLSLTAQLPLTSTTSRVRRAAPPARLAEVCACARSSDAPVCTQCILRASRRRQDIEGLFNVLPQVANHIMGLDASRGYAILSSDRLSPSPVRPRPSRCPAECCLRRCFCGRADWATSGLLVTRQQLIGMQSLLLGHAPSPIFRLLVGQRGRRAGR